MNNEYMNELDLDEINVNGNYRSNTMFFINHLSLMLYFDIKNILNDSKVSVINFIDTLKDIRVVKNRDDWSIRNLSKKEKATITN